MKFTKFSHSFLKISSKSHSLVILKICVKFSSLLRTLENWVQISKFFRYYSGIFANFLQFFYIKMIQLIFIKFSKFSFGFLKISLKSRTFSENFCKIFNEVSLEFQKIRLKSQNFFDFNKFLLIFLRFLSISQSSAK